MKWFEIHCSLATKLINVSYLMACTELESGRILMLNSLGCTMKEFLGVVYVKYVTAYLPYTGKCSAEL